MAYYHSKYGYGRSRRKKSRWTKFILYTLAILIVLAIISGYFLYRILFTNNVWLNRQPVASVYIPTGSSYDDVKSILYKQGIIIHRNNFEWVAMRKNYPEHVKPGRYVVRQGMNNVELINMLRAGLQTPVMLTFNNLRNTEQLGYRVGQQIEADSSAIVDLLKDSLYISRFNLNTYTIPALFIPNSYEFYWNTDAKQFIERMFEEYQYFWDDERMEKAGSLEMTIPEVVTLASIIEKETAKDDEKARIAGVYINRLESKWLLQADPTLVFALGDFTVRRVLNEYKKIDSPYNTYKYLGLPPGPICIPSIASIDAVLNYEDHDYFFFCARDDMSGYHVFAETVTEHNRNARKYQRALDAMQIKK